MPSSIKESEVAGSLTNLDDVMAANFKITSASFGFDDAIPEQFTCEGAGISPPISWGDPPDGTESLALIVDDPDAPNRTFVHWLLFNLPPDRRGLPQDLDLEEHFADSDLQPVEGVNDFGDTGYGPPCPPPGDDPHGYSFRLYALDTTLDLGPGVTRDQLTDAMQSHILAEADLVGRYQRSAEPAL